MSCFVYLWMLRTIWWFHGKLQTLLDGLKNLKVDHWLVILYLKILCVKASGVCEEIGDHVISRYDGNSTSASCKLDGGLDCKLASNILLIDAPIFLVKLKFISRLSLALKMKLKYNDFGFLAELCTGHEMLGCCYWSIFWWNFRLAKMSDFRVNSHGFFGFLANPARLINAEPFNLHL